MRSIYITLIIIGCKTVSVQESSIKEFKDVQDTEQCSSGRWLVTCRDGSQEFRHEKDIQENLVCHSRTSIEINASTFLATTSNRFVDNCRLNAGDRLMLNELPAEFPDNKAMQHVSLKLGQLKNCRLQDGVLLKDKFALKVNDTYIGIPRFGSKEPPFEKKRAIAFANDSDKQAWRPLNCEEAEKLESNNFQSDRFR